jgi:hypothetical protein
MGDISAHPTMIDPGHLVRTGRQYRSRHLREYLQFLARRRQA